MTHAQAMEVSGLLYKRGMGHTLGVDPSSGHCSIEITDLTMPEDELLTLMAALRGLRCTLELIGGRLCILRT